MIFYEISGMKECEHSTLASDGNGWYAWTTRTIRGDLFGDRAIGKQTDYYGQPYQSILDDNASFIVWDAKETIAWVRGDRGFEDGVTDTQIIYRSLPLYMLGDTLLGVPDPDSCTPHTFIFLEQRDVWEERFLDCVDDVLSGKRGTSNKKTRSR
jgi:hypothetical protein